MKTNTNNGGKGSAPRKHRDDEKYRENYDLIFRSKTKDQQPVTKESK